jgi:hypothetical protein
MVNRCDVLRERCAGDPDLFRQNYGRGLAFYHSPETKLKINIIAYLT